MKNRLAVLIPLYHTTEKYRFPYLEDSSASIFAQDLSSVADDWVYSLYVIDHGSTCVETKKFLRSIDDPRFNLVELDRVGDEKTSARPLNHGFGLTYDEGYDAFCYVHSDDLLLEDALKKLLIALDGCGMAYARSLFLKERILHSTGCPSSSADASSLQIMDRYFPHHTSMWSRELMGEILNHYDDEPVGVRWEYAEDLDLTFHSRIVLAETGMRLGFADDYVYVWRKHDESITGSTEKEVREETVKGIYYVNGFDDLYLQKKESEPVNKLRHPFFWFPDSWSRSLRGPVKRTMNFLSGGIFYPDFRNSVDVDLNWFKR